MADHLEEIVLPAQGLMIGSKGLRKHKHKHVDCVSTRNCGKFDLFCEGKRIKLKPLLVDIRTLPPFIAIDAVGSRQACTVMQAQRAL
jgi:hypothetical protein